MISGRIRGRSRCFLGWVAAVIIAGAWLTLVSPVQAQSFKRVCKDGVVYYYFSNREKAGGIQSNIKSGGNKTSRPPGARKLSPQELEPAVQEASRHFNLPPSLIKAVIQVESNFVPTATSPKGAQGLMQLMPGTAEDLQVSNAYDVRENVLGGARYLRILLDKFGYRLPLALAAYNAGPQRVLKHQDIPPIKETEGFVRDVCVNFLQYSGEP